MRVAIFYFVFISTTGLVLPYFPKYLDALGFSGTQIARINSVGPALVMFVPLIWGFVADKTGRTALLLKIACAGGALALVIFAAGDVKSFYGVFAVWLLYSFFQSPMLPLADSLAIIEARRIGTDYARLRLWGSISFILVSFAFGHYLARGGDIHHVPALAACLAVFAAICVHLLRQYGSGPHRVPPSFHDARKLFHDPGLMWFLVAGMIHQAALSPYYIFFGIHVTKQGLGQDIVGWSMGLGVAAEVTMFWFARPLFERKPLFPLMAISFVLSAARWMLTASAAQGTVMALLQTCHAFTFALCYAGAIAHLEKTVSEPLRVTGRALFSAISLGLGSVLGHNLAGRVSEAFDTGAAFRVAAGLEIVALAPLFIAAKYSTRGNLDIERFNIGASSDDMPPPISE